MFFALFFDYIGNILIGVVMAVVGTALMVMLPVVSGKRIFGGPQPLRSLLCCLALLITFFCTAYHAFFALTYSDMKDAAAMYAEIATAAISDKAYQAESITQGDIHQTVDMVLEEMPYLAPYVSEYVDEVTSRATTVAQLPQAIADTICITLDNEMWYHITLGMGIFVVLGLVTLLAAQQKRKRGSAASGQYCDTDFSF